jgi:hypothetical protein
MAVRVKVVTGNGLLLSADGKRLVSAVDYRVKAKTPGESPEWSGIITVLAEIPMDAEYSLELDQELDGRSGRLRLESFKVRKEKNITVIDYVFKGTTSLL